MLNTCSGTDHQKGALKFGKKIINRKDLTVTKNTKVCSNHVVHGKPLGDHLHLELWLRGYSGKETSNISVSQTLNRLCGDEDIDEGFLKTRRGTIKRKRTVKTETINSKRQMIEDTVDTQFQKQSSLEEQSQPETNHSLDYNTEQCVFNLPESDHTYCNLEDQNYQISAGDECSCQNVKEG